jgi:hypothetical protein
MRFFAVVSVLVFSIAGMSYGASRLHPFLKPPANGCCSTGCPSGFHCDVHVHCGVQDFACVP